MFHRIANVRAMAIAMGAIAILTAAVLLTMSINASSTPPAGAHYSELTKVPGFGRAPADVKRDNAIALYEAYQRELHISTCMTASGFTYTPEIAFPEQVAIDVVNNLQFRSSGIQLSKDAVLAGAASSPNAAYADSIDPDRRDNYYTSLYGISKTALDNYTSTGMLPEGAEEDYARGGCVGSAKASIPGLWALRRQVMPALQKDISKLSESQGMADTRSTFSECTKKYKIAANSMAQLENEIVGGTSGAAEALRDCESIWIEGMSLARSKLENSFAKAAYADDFKRQKLQYENIMQTIANDSSFIAYIIPATDEARTRLTSSPLDFDG